MLELAEASFFDAATGGQFGVASRPAEYPRARLVAAAAASYINAVRFSDQIGISIADRSSFSGGSHFQGPVRYSVLDKLGNSCRKHFPVLASAAVSNLSFR